MLFGDKIIFMAKKKLVVESKISCSVSRSIRQWKYCIKKQLSYQRSRDYSYTCDSDVLE